MFRWLIIHSRGLFLVLASVAIVLAAQRQIEVDRPSTYRDAVLVTRVTVGNMEVQCGLLGAPGGPLFEPVIPFDSGDEWLRNTDVYLFNRTNKVIVSGRLTLTLPEMGNVPHHPLYIDFGRIPENAAFLGNGQPLPQGPDLQPLSWGPEQTFVVHLKDYADGITAKIHDAMPGLTPTQVLIRKGLFYFTDGMAWGYGGYSIPDPQQRGKALPTDGLYFPGNHEKNWPVPGHRWNAKVPGK